MATLEQGSRVSIVGGGPAGSLFAIHLLMQAEMKGLRLKVTIHERRSFERDGAPGCNMCAGILSSTFIRALARVGLTIPPSVIVSRISSYYLHTVHGTFEVPQPHPLEPIYTVYRGGGPKLAGSDEVASLDGFLLRAALERGAVLEQASVERVGMRKGRPVLHTCNGETGCELLVIATGVNAKLTAKLPSPYRPPATRTMKQIELKGDPKDIRKALGSHVHVVMAGGPQVDFGTLIPKGEYVTASMMTRGANAPDIDQFVALPTVQRILPPGLVKVCRCEPRVAMLPAGHPFGERMVVVGDAAVARQYKDGIGSAFETSLVAARTAVRHGISRADFERYYLPTCRTMAWDNRVGRFLFSAHRYFKESRRFFFVQSQMAKEERLAPYPARRMHPVTWGMFTGTHTYRHVFRRLFSVKLWWSLLRTATRFLPKDAPQPGALTHRAPEPKTRILVLGGGFGGVHTTLKLERALRRDPDVAITLVSDENFFLFTPMLHEVASGRIETRHIAAPIRRLRGGRHFRFIQARVHSVDLDQSVVHTDRGAMPYDRLVLALGSVTDTDSLGCTRDRVLGLKTLRDAVNLRNHVIRMFETASAVQGDPSAWLTFVVVGAGITGVQTAAELNDFVRHALTREYVRIHPGSIRVLLIQDDPQLLPDFHPSMVKAATETLEAAGIEVLLGCSVTRVGHGRVALTRGQTIATQTVVWTPGIRANPVVGSLPVDKDELGRVKVNARLEVPGHPGVYALGDNAHQPHHKTNAPLPPTAYVAIRQPKAVAANIAASLGRGRSRRYRYRHRGQMVPLGPRSALAEVFGIRWVGLLARLFWLAAYSTLIHGRYNRLRVLTDWLLASIFGLDSTLVQGLDRDDLPVLPTEE